MARKTGRLWTLLGLASGAAVGLWLWNRGTERAWEAADAEPLIPLDGDPASRLARALAEDIELAGFGLDVHTVSEGVIEINGEVRESSQRERVVAMAHNVEGIHTVVNRVLIREEDRALDVDRMEVDPGTEVDPEQESDEASRDEPREEPAS